MLNSLLEELTFGPVWSRYYPPPARDTMMRLMLGWNCWRTFQGNNLFLVTDNKVDKAITQKSNRHTRKHKTTARTMGFLLLVFTHAPCILSIEVSLKIVFIPCELYTMINNYSLQHFLLLHRAWWSVESKEESVWTSSSWLVYRRVTGSSVQR